MNAEFVGQVNRTENATIKTNLKPLKQWVCDITGKTIQTASEGYLDIIASTVDKEIITMNIMNSSYRAMDLPDGFINIGDRLDAFVGGKGKERFTSLISEWRVDQMINVSEYQKRLYVPFFEEVLHLAPFAKKEEIQILSEEASTEMFLQMIDQYGNHFKDYRVPRFILQTEAWMNTVEIY